MRSKQQEQSHAENPHAMAQHPLSRRSRGCESAQRRHRQGDGSRQPVQGREQLRLQHARWREAAERPRRGGDPPPLRQEREPAGRLEQDRVRPLPVQELHPLRGVEPRPSPSDYPEDPSSLASADALFL